MNAAPNLVQKQEFRMVCTNCGSNSWENVDAARMKPAGMHMCSDCGNISYPGKWAKYEDIKKHYRTSYRQPPNVNNLYTGQRKIHFHNAFLQDVFKEWAERNFTTPKVFEVGAAYGLVLNWLKNNFPQGEFSGTEWALTYKRNAKHEFGIDLVDDFDDTKKHDLIISYKVAEHQLDVDKELKKYSESLTENGYLYISVPTWLDSANNFGLAGFDLEYYYDPNHINVWTREHWENILERAGFEIVKKDYLMYDSTYLCKVNLENRNKQLYKANPEVIKEKLARIKQAYSLFTQQRYQEAISVYPDYPAAWISLAEVSRQELFKNAQLAEFIQRMIQACPTSIDVIVTATDLLMRADKFDDAIKYAEHALQCKPENPASLGQLMNLFREMALRARTNCEPEKEKKYWSEARAVAAHLRSVSTQHFKESTDAIYLFNAQID
jgi:SAM-dependent methyltransferase